MRIIEKWELGAAAVALAGGLLWALLPGHQPVRQAVVRAAALPSDEDTAAPDQTRLLYATMTWKSYRHPTSGIMEIYRLPGGDRLLRLADLATGGGPGLRVLLSPDPYSAAPSRIAVDLGGARRRATNYSIPAGIDLARIASAVIWNPRSRTAVAAAPIRFSGWG